MTGGVTAKYQERRFAFSRDFEVVGRTMRIRKTGLGYEKSLELPLSVIKPEYRLVRRRDPILFAALAGTVFCILVGLLAWVEDASNSPLREIMLVASLTSASGFLAMACATAKIVAVAYFEVAGRATLSIWDNGPDRKQFYLFVLELKRLCAANRNDIHLSPDG